MRGVWGRVIESARRDFVAGLLAFVPVVSTIVGVIWLLRQLDSLVLPKVYDFVGLSPADQPPFVGVAVTLAVILLAGALARSFVGRAGLRAWESLVDRIPIARSLYSVLKQFMQAVFGEEQNKSFSRVVLVEYPRRGLWCYAFVTGEVAGQPHGLPPNLTKVFIPSTPNPTTGYYLLVPTEDLRETGFTVEDAFRVIISAGIATPPEEEIVRRLGEKEGPPPLAGVRAPIVADDELPAGLPPDPDRG